MFKNGEEHTLFFFFFGSSFCTIKLRTFNDSAYTFPILTVPKQLRRRKKKKKESRTQDLWVLIKKTNSG